MYGLYSCSLLHVEKRVFFISYFHSLRIAFNIAFISYFISSILSHVQLSKRRSLRLFSVISGESFHYFLLSTHRFYPAGTR